MKKIKLSIKTILPAMAAAMMVVSCDVETTTVMFDEDHNFTQASDTVFSVLGIMSQVQQVAERTVLLGEARADLVQINPNYTSGNTVTMLRDLQNNDKAHMTDTTYNRYRDFYSIINNCNYYLAKADPNFIRGNKPVFGKERAVVSAYRAWAYLQLAEIYGKVPFYTKPLLSYSEIENVYKDESNRKGMEDICSYFIDDLKQYVDVEYPSYGDFSYGTNATYNSQKFFLPVRLLLGDLYLWRGSCTGNKQDYLMAAEYYGEYLKLNKKYITQSSSSYYKDAEMESKVSGWNWGTSGSEQISFVPYAESSNYGKVSSLRQTFACMLGSESLKEMVDTATYTYTGKVIDEGSDTRMELSFDTKYFGTEDNPAVLWKTVVDDDANTSLAKGDLRLYQLTNMANADLTVNKWNTALLPTYRTTGVYLRFAEAINRAGFPNTAFVILKYGLSRGNLAAFDANGELEKLMQSGYDFWDMGNNMENIGIHARGCGNVESNAQYALDHSLSEEGQMNQVEDYLTNELALERSYEGCRFFDLMRFAMRRGESYLASRVARRNHPEMSEEQIESTSLYQTLMNKDNWYLNMVEN